MSVKDQVFQLTPKGFVVARLQRYLSSSEIDDFWWALQGFCRQRIVEDIEADYPAIVFNNESGTVIGVKRVEDGGD